MKLHVLAIEDNPGDARLIALALSGHVELSFETQSAESLGEAEDVLARGGFDAILLDLSLPDSFGLDTLTQCQVLAPDLPVIVLTGQAATGLGPELCRLGAQDYFPKDDLTSRDLPRAILHAIERNNVSLALRAANRELNEFAYRASHDLRAPARRIRALLGILETELSTQLSGPARDIFERIDRQAAEMLTFVDSILDLARSSRAELITKPLSLRDAVTSALLTLEGAIVESKASIKLGELPMIAGDQTLIASLLQNLLENAIKYCGDGQPEVEIGARALEGDLVEVSVVDHGIGFESGHGVQLFEPFMRSHGSERIEGAGVGLSLCRAIVERHGGTIVAESDGVGLGARFRFTLPLATQARIAG